MYNPFPFSPVSARLCDVISENPIPKNAQRLYTVLAHLNETP